HPGGLGRCCRGNRRRRARICGGGRCDGDPRTHGCCAFDSRQRGRWRGSPQRWACRPGTRAPGKGRRTKLRATASRGIRVLNGRMYGLMTEFLGSEAPLLVEGYAGLPVETEPTHGPQPGTIEWVLDAVERHALAEEDALEQYMYIGTASNDPV